MFCRGSLQLVFHTCELPKFNSINLILLFLTWYQSLSFHYFLLFFYCLLMNVLDLLGRISSRRRATILNTSRSLEVWLKSKQVNASGFSARIKGESTRKLVSSNGAKIMGYNNSLQYPTLLNRTGLQRGRTKPLWSVLTVC